MTHFNHEWTNDTTPIPQAVGDRFYAQDLNDDFNYLKHLPYEAILQGRNAGVMIPSSDTWNAITHTLSLSGGFGVVNMSTQVLDVDEEFVLPPKSITTSRIERVGFQDVTLTLPNDGSSHYIVATPTKRSLLQRTKALLSEQYASRIKYDGIITIQDSAPTSNQILVGMCHNDEYLLCKDFVLDQGKNTIKFHKWYGESKITASIYTYLQSYYGSSIPVEGDININNVSTTTIAIEGNSIFNNCIININTMTDMSISSGINGNTFNNCIININISNGHNVYIIYDGTFNNCTINIGTINGDYSYGIYDGTFNNCTINIGTINGDGISGISGGTFNNCNININTVSNGIGVENTPGVKLYLTHIKCTATTDLSSTGGKLNVLNNTVLHAS